MLNYKGLVDPSSVAVKEHEAHGVSPTFYAFHVLLCRFDMLIIMAKCIIYVCIIHVLLKISRNLRSIFFPLPVVLPTL